MSKKEKVILAMSGGVDSSVAGALLLEAGYEVIGITLKLMKFPPGSSSAQSCCGLEAVEEARRVAKSLGIPHYVLNFEKEFTQEVVEYFCREYARGRTPNPCIPCNQKLKFGKLLQKADELGAKYIASGHYARVEYNQKEKCYLLFKGKDIHKDQSYFLFNLTQEQLGRILFPLGEWEKPKVRAKARELGLSRVQDRPDSQEICFVPEGHYGEFLRTRMPEVTRPGTIIDKNGKVLGEHPGIYLFTVGQRRGLGIASPRPLYVLGINPKERTVTVGEEEELGVSELTASGVSWIRGGEVREPLSVEAKIRYRHKGAAATLFPAQKGQVSLKFSEPQGAVTPGQAVVFYQEEVVLGGGWIKN